MTALREATEKHCHTESLVERDRQRRKLWRNAGLVSMSNLLKPEKAPLVYYNLMQTVGKPKLHLATKYKIL